MIDAYKTGLAVNKWPRKNGLSIDIAEMSIAELSAAAWFADFKQRDAMAANNREYADIFGQWSSKLNVELNIRKNRIVNKKLVAEKDVKVNLAPAKPGRPKKGCEKLTNENIKTTKINGRKIEMVCHCGQRYYAPARGLRRGYYLSCSQSCAQNRYHYKLPPARMIENEK